MLCDTWRKNQGFISLSHVNSRNNYALQLINYHYL